MHVIFTYNRISAVHARLVDWAFCPVVENNKSHRHTPRTERVVPQQHTKGMSIIPFSHSFPLFKMVAVSHRVACRLTKT